MSAALVLVLVAATPHSSEAQEVQRDLHDPSVSPESSTGINPGTTRGMNRTMPAATPPMEAPYGQSSTTTITAATFDPNAPATGETASTGFRPHRPILLTGAAIFLGTYAASAVVGATVGTEADQKLAVPLVGPWLALGERSCTLGECGLHEDVNVLGLIASGAAQAAGVGLMITALFLEERREPPRAGVRVLPVAMGRGSAGVGAVGTF